MNASLSGQLAERASGLIVPAHLAALPEGGTEDGKAAEGGRDGDGRRRLVLVKKVRRMFVGLAEELDRQDLALILACKQRRQRPREVVDAATGVTVKVLMTEDIPGACGEILFREDAGGPDPGFGCQCSRVHFLAGV